MKFTIESVSKMTGIPAATLRNWEKRYGFPMPERTDGGHRYYCQTDIEFLKSATNWVEQGQGLSEIARLYREKVCPDSVRTQINPEIVDDVCYRTELIYDALLAFDQAALLQHYAVLNAKLGPEQLFERVFEQILHRLKRERALGKISSHQDHYVSAFIRMKLATYLSMDFPATQTHRILAATLSDDRCEAGLMLLTAHLKFRGYPIFYFGTGLPLNSLPEIMKQVKPEVLCLSYSSADRIADDLKELRKLDVPICLGGLALKSPQMDVLVSEAPAHIYFCQKTSGRDAAQFVEMICCRK